MTTKNFWLVKIDDHYGRNPRGPYPNQNQARLLAEEDEKTVTTEQLGIMRARPTADKAYPGNITISVWNCRAAIVLWHEVEGLQGLTFTPAANWEELEEEAIDAVHDQGGAVNMSGHYECPPELIARVRWLEEQMAGGNPKT